MFDPTKTDLGDLFDDMRQIRESMEGTDEAPQTMRTQDDPNIEAEDFNMEDYRDDDLEKVKSKTEDVPKEVPDGDLEQKPLEPKGKKHKTKESKDIKENAAHPLNLCNECSRTFRNNERICLYCESGDVLPIIPVSEGVSELLGEIPGVDRRDQRAVQMAIKKGQIPEEWPEEEEMIDALNRLEDLVPEEDMDDPRAAYVKYVLVPKAISAGSDDSYVLKHDGEEKGDFESINAALTWLHGNVPYSWDHAFKHEGWTLEQGGEAIDMTEAVVQEQEEAEEDHGAEARRAELKAKMAETEKRHSQEMERMAKELEGMGE